MDSKVSTSGNDRKSSVLDQWKKSQTELMLPWLPFLPKELVELIIDFYCPRWLHFLHVYCTQASIYVDLFYSKDEYDEFYPLKRKLLFMADNLLWLNDLEVRSLTFHTFPNIEGVFFDLRCPCVILNDDTIPNKQRFKLHSIMESVAQWTFFVPFVCIRLLFDLGPYFCSEDASNHFLDGIATLFKSPRKKESIIVLQLPTSMEQPLWLTFPCQIFRRNYSPQQTPDFEKTTLYIFT
jgi:hypothetical protein